MQKLYLISTCIKATKKYYFFHFCGYLEGKKVKQVKLEGEFRVGTEYLIEINKPIVVNEILTGYCKRHRELFNH